MPDSSPLTVEHDHPKLRLDAARLKRLLQHVVSKEGGMLRHLSVVLTDHDTVLHLNREYLDHDYHTDVLAFDLREPDAPEVVDGEVYVDLDTAQERHDEFGATFEEEAYRYAVHGTLHLLGYDDADAEDAATMRALEDRYLDALT